MTRIISTRRVLLVAVALLFAALAYAAVAAHEAVAKGLVVIQCGGGQIDQHDPIAAWNNPQSAHPHNFAGNLSTTFNSTTQTLEQGTTTCRVGSDKVSFWVPTLLDAGGTTIPMLPTTQYRLDDIGTAPGLVQRPPNGLAFIFGNAHNTNPGATAGRWACSGVAMTPPDLATIPTSCPPGATGIHVAIYPHHGCWNGVDLGPGLGRSTGPADAISHVRDGTLTAACPAPGVSIPRLSFILRYPLSAVGGRLASDSPGQVGGTTLHIDHVSVSGNDAMGRDFAQRVNDMCLNVVPDSAPPVGNVGVTCQDNAAGQLKRVSDGAIVVEGVGAPPPSFLFEDSFDGDLSKWTVMGGAPSTSAGKLVLPNVYPQSRVRALAGAFELEGRTATALGVNAPPGSNNDASKDRALVIEDTTNATQKVMFKISEGKLFAQISPGTQTFVPYDPVAHANLRVREAGGTVFWEASPDGAAWTEIRQVAAPSWVTANNVHLDLRSGAYYANGHDPASATTIDRVTVG